MVTLEYIIAQYQSENVSVAIHSRKVAQQNPALVIIRDGGDYIWRLTGLQIGDIENIQGEERANRIDFYIGMDDLIEQRAEFPATRSASLGLADGLRIPVGRERRGGKQIRWRGASGRVHIEDVKMIIPPYSLSHNVESDLILNIDRETSPYPITSDEGSQTIRELHFGIEHTFTVRERGNLRIARIAFSMTGRQYATVLEAIDSAIAQHQGLS
jgi:hypothetical protein